jgi:peptidoglycan/xylan/chitin deacetylase (PgdA/CDA1 family)
VKRSVHLRRWYRASTIFAWLASLALSAATHPQAFAASPGCAAGTLYLTLDTGNMRHAEMIAETLARQNVKASFFLANEKTTRGDYALDASWSAFWKARVAEGHAFGSHTFDHVYFKGINTAPANAAFAQVRPQFGVQANQTLNWDAQQICGELNRVKTHFQAMTGKTLEPIWRAPGGRAPDAVMQAALHCGYQHFYWAEAGFLGDELPSDRYPNQQLLERALQRLKSGDILMAHLGIWSRKDPFGPMFEPLIAGLKARGFCFATLIDHPSFPRAKRP